MTFLLAYLYAPYIIFLSMVTHMHIKLMNTFGNWLITHRIAIYNGKNYLKVP